jgi:TRAP-type C4-dicarboxylate transport system substrate-binding protein
MRQLLGALCAVFCLAAASTSTPLAARELRLSHQWPESDARHRAARVFIAELRKRVPDPTVSIHPNSSLKIKPVEQYDALLEGSIEMAIYPIAYASGKVPEMSIGGLPGVPSSFETAGLLKGTEFEDKLQKLCAENGFRVLTWWWVGGGIASRSRAIGGPESIKGLTARGGDKIFDGMLSAAGATVLTMPSSELRPAMEAGRLDVGLTSYESFVSFRLPELAKFATFGGYGIFTVLTPLVISKTVFDSLSDHERRAVEEAASISDIYFEATQREAEEAALQAFAKAGVKVQPLSFEEYAAWLQVARVSAWKSYQSISPAANDLFNAMLISFINSDKR